MVDNFKRKIEDIIRVVRCFEELGFFIKSVSKEQVGGFRSMLLSTLDATTTDKIYEGMSRNQAKLGRMRQF